MEELPGALGTSGSLALRLGQAIFAVGSLLFMCLDVEFYSYTAFWNICFQLRCCFLAREINCCLQNEGVLFCNYWFESFYLQLLGNNYGIGNPMELNSGCGGCVLGFHQTSSRQRGVLSIVVLGDWVLSFLSLAASCSTASVSSLLLASEGFCIGKLCTRYQLSAAMAFLSWFLSLSSSLFNLWLLPSV
ncbi:CASP-like protein 5C3 [Sesamum angolense]|uniref:CASP-like protein n=1 Tax=Sesamum angolense TaxID=2727404 RepID=A0AAE1WHQ9_9LAMI|nr:CASP-like protein 5C3 [Sesamum angolense]